MTEWGKKLSTEIQKIQIQIHQNPSVILNTELFHLLVNRKKKKKGVLFIKVMHNNSHSLFSF